MTVEDDKAPVDQGAPPIDDNDPDMIELKEALAAVKAEESAGQGDEQDDQAEVQQEPPAEGGQKQAKEKPDGKTAAPMIPKPRFDEVAEARDKAREEAAYWKGIAEARKEAAPAQQPREQKPPTQTPEQRLAELRTQIDGLAQRFDDGEITMSEFKREERALADQEAAIREEALLSKVGPNQNGAGDQLYLETLTAQLEQAHPWIVVFDQAGSEADWQTLKLQARERLIARGVDPAAGVLGTYHLRKEMAALADELGPVLVAHKAKAKGIDLPNGQPAVHQQQQAQPRSPAAIAREKKLELANKAPPNLQNMGTTGDTTGQLSDAQIESMTDDDIGNLPPAVRNKLLGITA